MRQENDVEKWVRTLRARAPDDAAELLARESPEFIRDLLKLLPDRHARKVAEHLPSHMRPVTPYGDGKDIAFPGSVIELMDPIPASVPVGTTVAAAVEAVRRAQVPTELTYLYITDAGDKLVGLVVLRDLMLSEPAATVDQIMLPKPFALHVDMPLGEACTAAVRRHYPVYPVVNVENRLLGQVRGWRLFEQQIIEISAQPGQMVGVQKEERSFTPLVSAFLKRHPWLQLNLLTAFIAAFVVGSFTGTIEKIVALAAFLPVLAGQSGNTGCQALAMTLRGLALGDVDKRPKLHLVLREGVLGIANGVLVGLVAAAAMWFYASRQPESAAQAPMLALVILLAMSGSCLMSGISGVLIPLGLRRVGADPAVASAIFLTTVTDIVGMGLMLGLATTLVL
ncbi:MAG: magnesium transporter [Mesorhizobium sp.]|uniref:Magnesium transporter n=1 Tax=Mesorhizobium mediterraneum TaxID=43617 RepID=A0AB36RCQ3_9HYPH|nr:MULTISPECIES: magnesium transporter [Mesorhizobium]AZO66637.1 magnesium transporter [Mesorhizobium sp. M6A.T.Cr.TU.016.01.1.1]PAQ02660.1 magnesium transporter [Mesorhizobium mediterraneum]RUU27787.1 magnesium transporter [Mesorhizobium sp. M6A.T.Ce.TU.016.01.1.1]RUV04295.1 magnesium transporter [Mesorhizobium sp. M6A.T.Cr.TU.017.01.1.1]RWN37639.1 MAG: magnesium transporter [Mesorhizobium sp.]